MTRTLRRERIQKFETIIKAWIDNNPVMVWRDGNYDVPDEQVTKLANALADAAASRTEVTGIEAAMFGDRPVTASDLPIGDEALKAFERDMQCPGSWSWYPAKSTDEPAWKALREFVVTLYQSDPKAFEKYYTWSRQPYSRGAMTVLGIKRNPQDFELSWAAFCASEMYSAKQEDTNTEGKGFYV